MAQLLKSTNKGQLLVEVLLAIALSAVILPALLTGLFSSNKGKVQEGLRLQAIALLKEAEEIARNVKDTSWSGIATNGIYHPEISGNSWRLVANSETINGLTRSITISDVRRDGSGSIVASGGTIDPSTKKVFSRISWGSPYPSSVDSTIYLTRYIGNAVNTQTSAADFGAGNHNSTTTTNTSGGEVTLGAGGGGGDWCYPSLSVTTVDLSRQGVPTAISATTSGVLNTIVSGTGGNASGPTFVRTLASGNSPVNSTPSGEFDNSKANGVFISGHYGFIATDSNSEEVKVLDLTQYSNPPTNTKFLKVGAFNAPGNTQANSIYVSGNYGYVTAADKFYIFDISTYAQKNPTAVTLSGIGKKVIVVGNYAYVITDATTNQFQVINVTNPVNPTGPVSLTLGSQAGVDLAVNSTGTRAFAVVSHSLTQQELYIIDITNKSSPQKISGSGYNTSGMSPKGISAATGNKVIIVGSGGSLQYQVVDISTETSPAPCGSGGLVIPGGAYAVSSILQNDGYAYSYVVTGDTNAELKIVLGGAGGQFSSSGTFTSAPLDPGSSVSYNYFKPTFNQPNQTSIQFQVAVTDPVNNSCTNANYSFVGPNGTTDPSDRFSDEGPIPAISSGNYNNPGRCFKYRAFLSTNDYTVAPILYDVLVNYSP